MNVIFDTIAGPTELEIDGSAGVTITRTGVIQSVDASVTADPFVLLRAADAAIAQAGQNHPAMSNAVINRLVVRSAKSTNDCTFEVTYRAGPLAKSGGGVRWLVEDDSTLESEEEELDLNGNPIQVIFTANRLAKGSTTGTGTAHRQGKTVVEPAGPFDIPSSATVAAESAARARITDLNALAKYDDEHPLREIATFPAPVLRPRRGLAVSGYLLGRPDAAIVDAQDCVNAEAWQGKRKGFWLCTFASSTAERGGLLNGVGDPFSNAGSLFRVRARFLTKVRRDWAHHFIHRTIKGKLAKQMCSPAFANRIKEIIDGDYSTEQVRCNGFTKVGMYPMVDFSGVFNF